MFWAVKKFRYSSSRHTFKYITKYFSKSWILLRNLREYFHPLTETKTKISEIHWSHYTPKILWNQNWKPWSQLTQSNSPLIHSLATKSVSIICYMYASRWCGNLVGVRVVLPLNPFSHLSILFHPQFEYISFLFIVTTLLLLSSYF
jgi:hypothetical protein